jgi:hypothetical protein
MATVINNPGTGTTTDSGSSASFLIGAIVLLVAVILILYYGLPALRSAAGTARNAGGSGGSAQINVPEKVDVNVNQTP